jgi:uncharacterized delta-60 repeat protein
MRLRLPLTASAAILLSGLAAAQTPISPLFRPLQLQLDWEQRYDHGILGHDSFAALALSPSGEVYAAGSSLGLNAVYTYEIVTVKYGASGALLWERRFDSPGSGFDDRAVAVRVSPNGDVVVLGQGPGSSGDQDLVTLCYDSLGNLKWSARYNYWWSDSATALTLAPDGSIYVLGSSYYGSSVTDVLLLKYDAAGTLLWNRNFHGGWGTDYGVDVGLDPAGNILIGGNAVAAPGGTNIDWLALKYDPAGNLLWSRTFAGAAAGWPDSCQGMHVDATGDLYLTGYLVNSSGVADFTTIKVDGAGNFRWSRSLGFGTGGGKVAATDRAGNVYVTGTSKVVSYDLAGTQRWLSDFTAPGILSSDANGIAVDPFGRVIVAGTGWDPALYNQFFTLALDASGRLIDWDLHGGPEFEGPALRGLAISASGRIHLAGSSPNGHDNDGMVLKYSLLP